MIEVAHLGKIYGSTVAIENVSFNVNRGEIVGFLGANGAGKTTIMRILAGYLPATSGSAKIAGFDVRRQSMKVRRRVGYLPETPPLYPNMTVVGFLSFVAKIQGVPTSKRQQQVELAIANCQLESKAKTTIRKLSRGYRQRVAIAQAIVHEPAVIILDEPTIGLDPKQIIETRNLIESLRGKHTVIFSSHILPEVNAICDRIIVIHHGKIVANNTPQNLQERLKVSYTYHIEVEGNIETLLNEFSRIPEILEIQHLENQYGEYAVLKIVSNNASLGKKLTTTIFNSYVSLHEMRRICPNLEDAFSELTTEDTTAKYI